MVDFYSGTLGLPFNLPYDRAQGWGGFQVGDVVGYLIELAEDGARARPAARDQSAPGLDSFAFEVDDLDGTIAELDARGVEWAGEVVESDWYRFRGFRDPEENLLYVTVPKASV